MNDDWYPEPPPGPCICDEVQPIEELVPRIEGSVVGDCPRHADNYISHWGKAKGAKTLVGKMLEKGGIIRDDSVPTGFVPADKLDFSRIGSDDIAGRSITADKLKLDEPIEFKPGGHVPGTIVVGPEVYSELVEHYAEQAKRGAVVLGEGPKIEAIEGVSIEIDYSGDPRAGAAEVRDRFVSYDGGRVEGGFALTFETDPDSGFVRFRNTWGADWGRNSEGT